MQPRVIYRANSCPWSIYMTLSCGVPSSVRHLFSHPRRIRIACVDRHHRPLAEEPSFVQPSAGTTRPRETDGSVCYVVAVSSHESAMFRGGGGHFCGRVTRLATRQDLLDFSSLSEIIVYGQAWPLQINGFVGGFALETRGRLGSPGCHEESEARESQF